MTSPSHYNTTASTALSTSTHLPHYVYIGAAGAIIGGMSAAAGSIKQVKEGQTSRSEATAVVVKQSAGTGVSAMAGAAAAHAIGARNLFGLATFAAVGIGVKYLWDNATEKRTSRT